MLSTLYDNSVEEVTRFVKRGAQEVVLKPSVACRYNENASDQMLYCDLDEHRTNKYWEKVTFNIIARMILNIHYVIQRKHYR